MKIIGLSSSLTENRTYCNTDYLTSFTRPGVLAVPLPVFAVESLEVMTLDLFAAKHAAHIEQMVNRLDGLVLTGGVDQNPLSSGNANTGESMTVSITRDFMDLSLLRAFVAAGKPVMGVCRGLQVISRFLALPNYQQHIKAEVHQAADVDVKDRQEPIHRVFLRGAFGDYMGAKIGDGYNGQMTCNSFHHQGLTLTSNGEHPKLGKNANYSEWLASQIDLFEHKGQVNVMAFTPLVVEAFEKPEARLFAVQWHPESYGPNGLTIGYWIDQHLYA